VLTASAGLIGGGGGTVGGGSGGSGARDGCGGNGGGGGGGGGSSSADGASDVSVPAGHAGSDDGQVTIVYADPINAGPANYSTTAKQALSVPASTGVLSFASGPGGDGLSASVASGPSRGTLALQADGSFLYTPNKDFAGSDSFTYDAADSGGDYATGTVSLTVAAASPDPPAAVSAVAGNRAATVSFTASQDDGGSPILDYTVTTLPGGAHASGGGSPITVGGLTAGTSYTFTVTATTAIGTSNPSDASNRVAIPAPPIAEVTSPANGRTYTLGEKVVTSFACSEGTGGPGLVSCKDSNGASSPAGRLDTSAPGKHTYQVTATSGDGLVTTTTISYKVTRPVPRPHFACSAHSREWSAGTGAPSRHERATARPNAASAWCWPAASPIPTTPDSIASGSAVVCADIR